MGGDFQIISRQQGSFRTYLPHFRKYAAVAASIILIAVSALLGSYFQKSALLKNLSVSYNVLEVPAGKHGIAVTLVDSTVCT